MKIRLYDIPVKITETKEICLSCEIQFKGFIRPTKTKINKEIILQKALFRCKTQLS